jgi:hypothetical protein
MSQLALEFERPAGKGPKIKRFHVDKIIRALYGKGWLTADELGFHTETDKRILRALAAASDGHIISGQAGYRLHFEATADESRVAIGGWRNMRDELSRRIIEAERVYHRKEVPECLRAEVEAARPAA